MNAAPILVYSSTTHDLITVAAVDVLNNTVNSAGNLSLVADAGVVQINDEAGAVSDVTA